MTIEPGIKGRAETVVVHENTAAAVGSGLAPVFSTPNMIGLMENAAVNALAPFMEPGESSVGTSIQITHDAATPIGMTVWAEAELLEVSGKAFSFAIAAFDEAGPIGKGTHGRFLIDEAKFLARVERKRQEKG